MMAEGLGLMAVGMTTVFAFLSLLVLAMHGSAVFFRSFADRFPEPSPPEPRRAAPVDDEARIAVVLAAIAAHRAKRS